MREFYIPSGKYEGTYNIYEGIEEFRKDYPDTEIRRWSRDEHPNVWKIGDWIQALDGYIIQILNISVYKNNSISIRVAMGTFAIRRNKHSWNYQKLYAQFTRSDQYSFGGTYAYSRTPEYSLKKDRFGQLLVLGFDPLESYKRAGFRMYNKNILFNKVGSLMMDKEVSESVTKYKEEWLTDLQNNEKFSNENLTKWIEDFMTHVRKGSQTHLNAIIPILKLLGKIPSDFNTGGNKSIMKKQEQKEIEEAQFENIPFPDV